MCLTSSHVQLFMLVALTNLYALSVPAAAAEVRFGISARETYVGQPVTLSIEIENVRTFERPKLPAIDGIAAQDEPSESRSTMMTIINGRTTQRETVTLTYRLVPFTAGTFTIPPISIVADGQTFTSAPMELIATKLETGDLMFAEIIADKPSIYLGQPLTLTLRVWIKPFQDRQAGTRLTADNMWSLVDVGHSAWSVFVETLAQQRTPFGAIAVPGVEVLRTNSDGSRGAYFEYDLRTTIWPKQTGSLQIDSPTITMRYPVRLARDVGFFATRGLTVAEHRPVSVTANAPQVEIKPPPAQGQPDTFNGAVGQFDIAVSAAPLEVAVGDPITLQMTMIDRTGGAAGRLELLAAPPLERVAELTENFRMPTDPIAGVVGSNSKTFTQTLRARNAHVTRIPPIPVSFFDPASETYITRFSEPIAIEVRPATQIGLSDVVQATGAKMPKNGGGHQPIANPGGILANYTDPNMLLKSQQFHWTWWSGLALLAPPMLFLGVTTYRFSTRYTTRFAPTLRKRAAKKRAIAMLQHARRSDPRAQAHAVISAINQYVADRFDLPAGVMTSDEIARTIAARLCQRDARAAEQVREIQTLLETCEQITYAGAMSPLMNESILDRAAACIRDFERSRFT